MAEVGRCFVGVWPPAPLREALARLTLPPQLRIIDPARHHVTLRFLGSVDVAVAAEALGALRFEPTPARAGPLVDRLGPRHLVVPIAGLDDLAGRVSDLTAAVTTSEDALPFRGHLSLATSRDALLLDASAGGTIDCEFEVDEVSLIVSRSGCYETVAAYPASRPRR